MGCEQFADPLLVAVVDVRPKQAHGDGFDPGGLHLLDRGQQLRFIQRPADRAIRKHALGDLPGERPWNIGRRRRQRIIEYVGPPALPEHQDVRVAFRREKGRSGRPPGHDRVQRVRRAIDEHAGARQQLFHRETAVLRRHLQRGMHPFQRFARRRGRLGHSQLTVVVFDDQVRESTSSVDSDSHGSIHLNEQARFQSGALQRAPCCYL